MPVVVIEPRRGLIATLIGISERAAGLREQAVIETLLQLPCLTKPTGTSLSGHLVTYLSYLGLRRSPLPSGRPQRGPRNPHSPTTRRQPRTERFGVGPSVPGGRPPPRGVQPSSGVSAGPQPAAPPLRSWQTGLCRLKGTRRCHHATWPSGPQRHEPYNARPTPHSNIRALSSAGERCLHTAEAAGSKPAAPTQRRRSTACAFGAPERPSLASQKHSESSGGDVRGSMRTKVPDKVYELRVSLGRRPRTGGYRQQSVTVRGSRSDAQRALRRLLDDIEPGRHQRPDGGSDLRGAVRRVAGLQGGRGPVARQDRPVPILDRAAAQVGPR